MTVSACMVVQGYDGLLQVLEEKCLHSIMQEQTWTCETTEKQETDAGLQAVEIWLRGLLGSARAMQMFQSSRGPSTTCAPTSWQKSQLVTSSMRKLAAVSALEYLCMLHLEVCQAHEQLAAVASKWTTQGSNPRVRLALSGLVS